MGSHFALSMMAVSRSMIVLVALLVSYAHSSSISALLHASTTAMDDQYQCSDNWYGSCDSIPHWRIADSHVRWRISWASVTGSSLNRRSTNVVRCSQTAMELWMQYSLAAQGNKEDQHASQMAWTMTSVRQLADIRHAQSVAAAP